MPFKCENCVHFSVCQEIEHLPQRKMFIWYDAKYGCPHYTETGRIVIVETGEELKDLSQYPDILPAEKP